MDLVAGPPGSGKSTFFPVAGREQDSFNIDERRKELNKGSSQGIPREIREQAITDYNAFIDGHIRDGKSFSIEVTLAKDITFEQAERAKQHGFRVHLTYVAAELEDCIQRVANRVEMGGHGVSPDVLRETYSASMANLPQAIRGFDVVQIYDNGVRGQVDESLHEAKPRLVLEAQRGALDYLAPDPPRWLTAALADTEYHLE